MDNQNQDKSNGAIEETNAELEQQKLYDCFGDRDWDVYRENEHVILKRCIGFALFGAPTEVPSDQNETGYEQEKNDEINKIYDLFMNNNFGRDEKSLYIRIIFICWNFQHEDKLLVGKVPVFVLKKCQIEETGEEYSSKLNCKVFVDGEGRVYDNWQSYLTNNKLPKCTMVCPQDGQYKGILIDDEPQVLLEYHESPACSTASLVLNAADMAGTGVSVLTTVGALASLAVTAPALGVATAVGGGATAAYMVGRNIYNLKDRASHQQSIGLDNSESRWSWFGIGTGVVGTAATAATGIVRSFASQGKNISRGAQISYNILNGVNMAGSTTGIIFSGYNLYDKYRNDEPISALEIFQFSASVLFFYRSAVDFHTAESLINKTQEETLQNYEKSLRSNRHRKVYRKALKETERLNGKMAGRAEVISGINNIADKDNFFAGLVRVNKDMNKKGARFEITADGYARINSAHIVDPNEFANMNRADRANILTELPPRQITTTIPVADFNSSQFIVNENLDSIMAKIGMEASTIILKCINTADNRQTFAFLLTHYAKVTVRKLFEILYKFLDEIQNRFQDFTRCFPGADVAVGALQFLINYLKNIASEVELTIDEFINCVFDSDGNVNTQFLQNLVSQFNSWLDERFVIFQRNSSSATPSPSNNVRQRDRKTCKKCCGHYYVN